MTDITIPPEALEAGARAMCRNAYKHLPEMSNQDTYTPDAEYWLDQARACFNAMIGAWPDTSKGYSSTWWGQKTLMLPIGQVEFPNDKA